MTEDAAFQRIQKIISNTPLILAGTGVSIPHGIPGMKELAKHLQNELNPVYPYDPSWSIITERLSAGKDLESALTDVSPEPSEKLMQDITIKTWELVSKADLDFFDHLLQSDDLIPFAKLLHILTQSSKKSVNVITTNYDRLIEYACDQAKLALDDRFRGQYKKWRAENPIRYSNIINLLKVHGSLDSYKTKGEKIVSIPQRRKVPSGLMPDIIPPGSNKYRSALQGMHRKMLFHADECIRDASGFLCIGYGFNDEHIQEAMLERVRLNKPVIVVTKEITDDTASMLRNQSTQYVTITADHDDENRTELVVDGDVHRLDGRYWTVDGFIRIIE